MRLDRNALLGLGAGLALLAGCGRARTLASSHGRCTSCHGGADNPSGAPPFDTRGNSDPASLSVGQHTAHVNAAVACTSCHPDRPSIDTPGHRDGKVDVEFHGLAVAGGGSPAPSFDPQTGTCSNVYCHGATLHAGGQRTTPTWNQPLGTPECTSCHGFPPTSDGHPARTDCATCHPETVNADGTLVAGGKHLNGVVDAIRQHPEGYADRASAAFHGPDAIPFLSGGLGARDCASCHGADLNGGTAPSCTSCHEAAGWANPSWQANCTFCHGTRNVSFTYLADLKQAAPPESVAGETSGPRVGAHEKHLSGGALSNGFSCATCHAVPAQSAPLAHLDGTAEVVLQGAGQGSLPADLGTYAPATQTCASYCHGATLQGGSLPNPQWTATGLACDSCHGLPPATGRHPSNFEPHSFMGTNCAYCHLGVVDSATGLTVVDRARHVNGAKDVALVTGTFDAATSTCATACHGDLQPQQW